MSQLFHNRKGLEPHRKQLRHHSTSAEGTLWNHLKSSQLGRKIRRQHPVGNYILDFYCELDGAHHFTSEGMMYDEKRTRYLEGLHHSTQLT